MATKRTHSQVKAALMRARTLLSDRQHWAKHEWRTPINRGKAEKPEDFAYCALGALQQAANCWENDPLVERDRYVATHAEQALLKAVREQSGRSHMTIIRFNDSFATHASLLQAFDRAIEAEARLAQQEARS